MAPFERITTTFTRGELSPRVTARVDFEGRFDGVEKLENFVVQVQGGAQKRSGTRFVKAAKDEINAVRLIPFEVSVEQNYIVEVSPNIFRFYADEAMVENPPGTPVEVATPYTPNSLLTLKWTQSADILFLVGTAHKPRELRRTSPTTFSLIDFNFQDGPYLDINTSATTLTLNPGAGAGTIASGTTGVTLQASAVTGINDGLGFLATDVERLVRVELQDSTGWTWLEITAVTDADTATVTVRGPAAKRDVATANWNLGAWSTVTGWPEVVMFHQGRLWFGRTKLQPQTLWSSNSGSFRLFRPSSLADLTVTDSHSVTVTIDSNQVNAISWLSSTNRGLLIGTIGESWMLRAPSEADAISPTNVQINRQGAWGVAAELLPASVGAGIIYAQRGRTVIREAAYSFDDDLFSGIDVSILSEHLFRKGVKRLVFAQTPIQTVWALLEDGTLAGFTFDKEQKVIAWHHHTIAGLNAQILDIAVVKEAQHDQLWLAVRRTVNATQHQYIEFMEDLFDAQLHSIEDAFFLDSALSYSGTPTSTLTGLTHLVGEAVAVLADGSLQPDKVVSSDGQITLDRAASEVHVGLLYKAEIDALPLEAPTREGSFVSLGKTKRIHQVLVLLAETVGVKIGPLGGKLDELIFRTPSVPMGLPVPLFNGIKRLSLESTWEDAPRVRIVSDRPLPCTVLAIVAESQIYGS